MKEFCHRNVARLYASFKFESDTKLATVMEICQTDLQKLIEKRIGQDPFPLETVMKWCSQMLCGLKYLHGKNVIHRDIKPEVRPNPCLVLFNIKLYQQNVLIVDDIVKITDFNVSKKLIK